MNGNVAHTPTQTDGQTNRQTDRRTRGGKHVLLVLWSIRSRSPVSKLQLCASTGHREKQIKTISKTIT